MKGYQTLIEEASRLMADLQMTIGFAESASAGKLSFDFSRTKHSGAILKGGLVCYNACVKEDLLGIPRAMIDEFTPESAEITREMALRLGKVIGADIRVAVTGLTTPGGSERPGKPVGTMYYCIAFGDQLLERKKIFEGTPVEIIDLTIEQIAKTLVHQLNEI